MADYDHLLVLPGKAASVCNYGVAVTGDTTTADQLLPAASVNILPLGLTIATVGTTGIGMSFARLGKAKAMLAASCGPNQPVGVASANGALGPVSPLGVQGGASLPVAAQGVQYQVGITTKGGVAGQITTVILDPRQLV